MTGSSSAFAWLNRRDPLRLSRERFDLVVVGGGVYGAMIALEAVRRGLRPLVLERTDFAAATSSNSLRIIHGGLRYLQNMHVGRHLLSVRERAWFLATFPDYVQPLPVLMTLRGDGLRRRSIFRGALAANNVLTRLAIGHMEVHRRLPPGRTLSAEQTRDIAAVIDTTDLDGGALWHDAFIPDAPALVIEILRWACCNGATVLNYVEARELILSAGRVSGVKAWDMIDKQDLEFRADVVVNAAGPWARSFVETCNAPVEGLPESSLAWNLVLRRSAWTNHALALAPPYKGAQTFFLVPWKGVLLAGTGHAPWRKGPSDPRVPVEFLRGFIDDLNKAVPGFDLTERDVARILVGLLPASRGGSQELAKHYVIVDHARRGGPGGLFSLSGVKFTEARAVADRALRTAFPARQAVPYEEFPRQRRALSPDDTFAWLPDSGDVRWLEPLREIVRQEGVEHLDDLMLRRSTIGDNPERALQLAPLVCKLFAWDAPRADAELAAMRASVEQGVAFLHDAAN
jgi:glycerol-3-phosphate dehydrogenase